MSPSSGADADAVWTEEMCRIIDRARRIVDRGEAEFFDDSNPVEFLAARMVVIELDVAAERLSEEFRDDHPDVPWRQLARARDKYARHFESTENIDRGVLWDLLTHRLPAMAETLRG